MSIALPQQNRRVPIQSKVAVLKSEEEVAFWSEVDRIVANKLS